MAPTLAGRGRRGCSASVPVMRSALPALAVLLAAAALVQAEAASAVPTVLPEVPVTGLDERLQLGHNSPLLMADPTRPRFVAMAARLDNPDFGCTLHLSGDGGRGWIPVKPVTRLPEGADKCYAPEVAFDRDGVMYYLFIALAGQGNSPSGTYLVTSSDRGRTFTTPRPVLGPERYMVRMAMDRAAGRKGRLHLVWLEAGSDPPLGGLAPPPNPLRAAYSDDGGRTFSAPVTVGDPERRIVAPALAVGRDGRVHVLYYDLEDDVRDYQGLEGPVWEGTWSLRLSSSDDGGRSFGAPVTVDAELVPPERVMLIFTMPAPALAVAPSGVLHAAWHDARNGDWDVFARRSRDGGRTWDPAIRVNDDPTANGRHQYLPRLAVGPTGRLDAIFLDRRDDPDNARNHSYLASSTDGGRTFGPNLRITSEPSDAGIGTRYDIPSARGLVEFGSRIGLLSRPDGVLAAWTDTRNAEPGEYAQDIFATEVDLDGRLGPTGGEAEESGRGAAVAWAGGLAAGAVAATVAVRRRRRRLRRHHSDQPEAAT